MDVGHALLTVGVGERPASFDVFQNTLDPEWIQRALAASDTASVRRRKLPAERAVWLVIGMGLFRDRSIEEVVQHLGLVLPASNSSPGITSSGIGKARDRLGAEPLAHLFEATAEHWAAKSARDDMWRGLTVFGVDGSSLRVQDTPVNDGYFGRPSSRRGKSGYPQLRLVTLMVLRSHLLQGMSIGPWSSSEISLAESLWAKIPDGSLTILDRGFLSYSLLHGIRSNGTGRQWLIRAKARLKWRVLKSLGENDSLVEITTPKRCRREHPTVPETLVVRAVRYQYPGFRPQTLLTSLVDPEAFPAREIAALYHERWELELGFDEIKTHALEREESLRSKSPERTRQEVWGLAVAYNLIRLQMGRVGKKIGLPPTRISFRHSLLLIRGFWWATAWTASPGKIPERLEELDEQTALLILPPRRKRTYPRAVKIKMSNYPRKG
jgi:Insertion element 4 transposase N-terminal/Transposase DDE domain